MGSCTGPIRVVASCKRWPQGSLQLRLRVTPRTSKSREGVVAIKEDAIELCVSAVPRDGAANKAVVRVLSEALRVPTSALDLTHGLKSRCKTVSLTCVEGGGDTEASVVLELLRSKMAG